MKLEQGTSYSSTFHRSNALLWYVRTPTTSSPRRETYPEIGVRVDERPWARARKDRDRGIQLALNEEHRFL